MKLSDRMDAVMAIKIPMRLKAVLWVLARRAKDETGHCFSSLSRLSLDSGASQSTVQRSIKALERLGIVKVVRHPRRVLHFWVHLGVVNLTTLGGQSDLLNLSFNRKTKRQPQKQLVEVTESTRCIVCKKRPAVLDNQCDTCIASRARRRDRLTADTLPSL